MHRILTTSNVHQWRKQWNVSDDLWLQLKSEYTMCNDTMCTGWWIQYNVSHVHRVCCYHVLPLIIDKAFWTLQMVGDWLDPKLTKPMIYRTAMKLTKDWSVL